MKKVYQQVSAYISVISRQGHARHLAFMRRTRNRSQQYLVEQIGEQLPAKIKAAAADFAQCYVNEDSAYKKMQGSDLTPQLADADAVRDNLLSGVRTLCEALQRLGTEEQQKAAALVLKQYHFYKLSPDLKYEDEGIQTEQFCADCESNFDLKKAVRALGMTDHIESLKQANQQAMDILELRNQQRGMTDTEALKNARQETDDAYRNLITLVNAYAVVENSDEGGISYSPYDVFIRVMNADIDYHRRWVLDHPTGDDPAPDPEPEPEPEPEPTPEPEPEQESSGGEA